MDEIGPEFKNPPVISALAQVVLRHANADWSMAAEGLA
jgi:hypothetical protein